MAQALTDCSFERALAENATGKRTRSNQNKTRQYLHALYDLDRGLPRFRALMAFWEMTAPSEQPLLALLYALGKDSLLAESAHLLIACPVGASLPAAIFSQKVSERHPGRYSEESVAAIGQRLASSWKQAGYLRGMYANRRTEVMPGYQVLAFAMLLAYLAGARGQFILQSPEVQALCLAESRIRELAFEASKRDLMRFQSAGAVITVSFETILNKLDIHDQG
ncbi:MAG: hypothetical protein NW241_02395 [Bacteroidia bacterium]|nr:hypothetical protein [Bacteroidia bacterium]